MKVRTGVDLIEVERIQQAVERHGERFLERVFTPQELEDCNKDAKSLAARFAAKEAASKAFGTGIGEIRFKDLEIVRDQNRAPFLILHGEADRLATSLGLHTWSISLSHTDNLALAFVVATGD